VSGVSGIGLLGLGLGSCVLVWSRLLSCLLSLGCLGSGFWVRGVRGAWVSSSLSTARYWYSSLEQGGVLLVHVLKFSVAVKNEEYFEELAIDGKPGFFFLFWLGVLDFLAGLVVPSVLVLRFLGGSVLGSQGGEVEHGCLGSVVLGFLITFPRYQCNASGVCVKGRVLG